MDPLDSIDPLSPAAPSVEMPAMALPPVALPAPDDGSKLAELTAFLTPYLRQALAGVHPSIGGTGLLGRAEAMMLAPAWNILTGPFLPVVVQLGLQVGLKLLSAIPWVGPTVGILIQLAPMIERTFGVSPGTEFLSKLFAILETPAGELHPAVIEAVAEVEAGVGSTGPVSVPVGFNPNQPGG